jgi:hypothetical protein
MKQFKRLYRFGLLGIVMIAMLVVAAPTFAAPGGTLLSYSLNAAGCYVDVTAQVQDAGFYAINFWDDGNFRAGAGGDIPAGGTLTVRLTIGGVILQGAAGIGVYLQEAVGVGATATYDADGSAQLWSDQVGMDCANAGHSFAATFLSGVAGGTPCLYPLPVGSFVYSIPDGALAYYDDDPTTYTGFNLPPGTWYISEFGEQFAKVWIACQAQPIYIPVGNVLR